jgi:hypothetical protein
MNIWILIAAILVPPLTAIAISEIRYGRLFEYDKVNPFRRRCRKCRQVYSMFTYAGGDTGWQPMGHEIWDPGCRCHKYESRREG